MMGLYMVELIANQNMVRYTWKRKDNSDQCRINDTQVGGCSPVECSVVYKCRC